MDANGRSNLLRSLRPREIPMNLGLFLALAIIGAMDARHFFLRRHIPI
jgi:hypothetical protein